MITPIDHGLEVNRSQRVTKASHSLHARQSLDIKACSPQHSGRDGDRPRPPRLDSLEPLLRVYEGFARAYLGEVEGANLIKLHRRSGKVSYLVYPDFATDPHPALLRSIKLSLRTRELDCYDYATSTNPPILHRKETFLPPTTLTWPNSPD